jgi:hypothetical protein
MLRKTIIKTSAYNEQSYADNKIKGIVEFFGVEYFKASKRSINLRSNITAVFLGLRNILTLMNQKQE